MITLRRGPKGKRVRDFDQRGEIIDPWFDDDDGTLDLVAHQIATTGSTPLHPDANRITTYDPVPLQGDDERYREGPFEPESTLIPRPPPPVVRPGPSTADQDLIVAWIRREIPLGTFQPVAKPPECPEPEPLERLPEDFTWLVADTGARLSQLDIELFWEMRRRRDFPRTDFWPGEPTRWACRPNEENP